MNLAWTGEADRPPHWTFTSRDVARMVDAGILGEDDRVELIEGELIATAAKYAPHEMVKSVLVRAFVRSAPDDIAVAVASTIQISDRTIVEPDIAIFPQRLFARPKREFLKPGPGDLLLIVEVADSSLRYDTKVKAPLYARHGVREVWIVDADTRVTTIHTGPQADGTWTFIAQKRPDEALATQALPGLSVRLDRAG